ncbi:MAG: hypothetical protein GTN74_16205 [Proteobacteria bacterium]|nr:hypothetical protein [Pseudomonadota bacterium]NIS72237.1 hypothetical protein [Pseudomonadota bacterium]
MTKERRSHPRVEVSHPVLYFSSIHPRPRLALTVDLSLGGTQIETLQGLAENEGIEVAIHTDLLVIKCKGKVIHVLEPEKGRVRAGIQFDAISEYDKLYLMHHLLHLMEKRALQPSLSL